MNGRLFEKTVRKKQVPPEVLLWIILFIIFVLCFIVKINVDQNFRNELMLHYSKEVILSPFDVRALVGCKMLSDAACLFSFVLCANSSLVLFRKYCSLELSTSKNVIFIDQAHTSWGITSPMFNTASLLYLFLEEPYIYRMEFLTDAFRETPYNDSWERLHFNIPIHSSYEKNKDYNLCCGQYRVDPRKTEIEKKSLRFTNFKIQKNKNGRDWHRYSYYITYEKAQLLNKVFDAVELPAFRVVVNENQRRLISIHPIEGREYPEEIPELLDKINAMYP